MKIQEKAAQMVATAQIITVASVDENGYPRPVAMVKLKDEDGAIYVSTGTSSAKTAHFKANPKAGVSIVRGGDSIVYTGKMEIVTDEAVKRSLWGDWMLDHFPGGVEDPEYCVLKFTPESATYWIDNAFVKNDKYMNLFCQSCGMPLQNEADYGTEAGGARSEEYCTYCYQNGGFTADCTMDEMIDFCIRFEQQQNPGLDAEDARRAMRAWYPTLKRWKQAQG